MILKEKRSLLIVEDEKELQEILALQLTGVSEEIYVAGSGEEALEIIKGKTLSLVLCDIELPKISGLELLSQVRAMGCIAPFVFLTGYKDEERILQALRLGAVDFLEKPFNADALVDVVNRALEIGVRRASLQKAMLSGKPREQIQDQQKMISLLQVKHNRQRKAR